MTGSKIAQAEDIIWRRIDDEAVIIREDGSSLHVLNKTATHIWELCDGGCGADEIVVSLVERFDVSFEEASEDVKELVTKLEQIGLLNRSQEVMGQ